jgi:osmoprotectant transport system substrate-binding protein
MTNQNRLRLLLALVVAAVMATGIAACGSDDDDSGGDSGESSEDNLIEENAENNGVKLTVGSKNFTEQIVLGEIYAQALEAAGYDVSTDLNLGSEVVALKALEDGEISGYPEYTSTALTAFFDTAPEDVPSDGQEAIDQAQPEFEEKGLVAHAPTEFSSANAVGLLTERAEELGVETISDLEGQSEELDLYGSPECRQRVDCLVGLEENYGLEFKSFTPVDIGIRYEVLDNEEADLSILFTTDAQLYTDSDTYTILEDDQGVLPAGNVTFVTSQEAEDEAGPDLAETVEKVQGDLSLEVMQELNAKVDVDKESPEDAAREYLEEFGYIES